MGGVFVVGAYFKGGGTVETMALDRALVFRLLLIGPFPPKESGG